LRRLELFKVTAVSDDLVLSWGAGVEAPVIVVFSFQVWSPLGSRLLHRWRVGYKRVVLKTLDLLCTIGHDLLHL
jgi:hypothetical protein